MLYLSVCASVDVSGLVRAGARICVLIASRVLGLVSQLPQVSQVSQVSRHIWDSWDQCPKCPKCPKWRIQSPVLGFVSGPSDPSDPSVAFNYRSRIPTHCDDGVLHALGQRPRWIPSIPPSVARCVLRCCPVAPPPVACHACPRLRNSSISLSTPRAALT